MFVIMGASGQTGGAILAELARRGAALRAVSRDPERARARIGSGVEIVAADARDEDALARAFEGAHGVYVLNVPATDAPDPQAAADTVSAAIAGALRRTRPARVVALSSEGAHRAEGTGVIRTLHRFEAALAGTGLPVSLLRATYFMENWAAGLAPARAEGVLPSLLQPLDRKVRMVSVADIGRVAADLLLSDERAHVVNLVGPEDYSPTQSAEAFATALGRPVAAVAPPRAAWEPALVAAGLSAGYATEFARMYDAINAEAVGFEPGAGELRRGRVPLAGAIAALAA